MHSRSELQRITNLTCILVVTLCVAGATGAAERPNIILVMVDDMGFSDLGCYGGEIDTPNIDALAAGGVRFSQFYNTARCCPTRATLMTGLHPHQAGIGHMTNDPHNVRDDRVPAYQGYLNRNCVTIAEVLHQSGYDTLMTGKWHLGFHDQDRWPLQRGFDKYYGCIPGATRFFYPEHPRGMTFGNEAIETPESTTDEAFYTTDAFTDYAIRFIDEHEQQSEKPFFLYLAYTAPHWPLQAFEDDIAKYRGRYKIGWDELRRQRYQHQIELGLIDPQWKLSQRTNSIPAWDSLDEAKQDEMDLKMAIYAAMVDRIDQNMGKLTDYLTQHDLLNNTLIIFLSDNGACAEGGILGRGEFYDVERRNQQPANSYGEAWANASCTPFRLYKHFAHEGGTSTPFFMHWPAGIKRQNDWYTTPGQLVDVMPTILDVAGAEYPTEYEGHEIPPGSGVSLRPAFQGSRLERSAPICIEHENNAFLRDGKWKLVGRGVAGRQGVREDRWQLYDMQADRTETNNLADEMPEKVNELAAIWEAWAKDAKVYPKP
ncbi:arylsulfatase [Aeoliella sp. ICT_H6.2]|uniref:Arylsulfatase n=1 Tax=Aeoliella straminimaris TaxID=2954799 RepID=A0A9X2FEG6_9BACT|nr:arylsulfatase [Aeoliella straminimaris]MCO6044824.1 arylsulfatase [Aeoliella straminimaris]